MRLWIVIWLCLLAACQTIEPEPADLPQPGKIKTSAGMHPSWDSDGDGINDCEKDGSCDHSINYSQARPQPSFDCSHSNNMIEQLICNDNELADLDQQLHHSFQAASEQQQQTGSEQLFQAEQRGWIKGRDDCWKADDVKSCVRQQYLQRNAELQSRYELLPVANEIDIFCPANNEHFQARFFATTPATVILAKQEQSEVLYQQRTASGSHYRGRDIDYREHQGVIAIRWGYGAEPVNCTLTKNSAV